ncbi:MAG: right-handed parallel beta-helix repeat-containing protein [Cyclobacteriaceae bacterium]
MSQQSKSTWNAIWAGTSGSFADNTSRAIVEATMRAFGLDAHDSLMFITDHAYESFHVSTSGTDTYTATLSPAITAYANGQRVYLKFTNANTGAATINLNGLGAKTIKKSGGTDLAAGDIQANQILCLIYDGTNFQVVGGGGGTSLTDPLVFKGAIDCSANPNYPAADAGDLYKVSVAGKIGGGSGPNVEVGDTLVCTVDSSASGNHATVGANWLILQTNIDPSLYALLASPAFTGTPTAPTAAQGTDTTQIATTAFVQAEVTILETLINGGYTDVAFVNSFSGVDHTGATDSKTGLQAAMASGKKVIVFDGLYRTTDILTLNTGQTVILRGGTVIELYGNVNTGVALFAMANKSSIIAEPGARLTHTPTGTASYSGIYVDTKYQWAVLGKMTIEKFGNQGIRVQGTASSPNQYRNGIIKDVICRDNINNGFGGASGAGHGIEVTTADYVFILDVDCYDNQGYGVYFDRVANSPINNTRIIHNTLGGLRIDGDYAANTDHFHVSNCQINHNDTASTWNVHVKDVDTGVNFNGCSIYGGNPFKVENSRGVSFNGCGLTTGTAVGSVVVTPGDKGDGIVKINGGHVLYSTKAMTTYTSGGGTVIMDNVMETVITPLYTSNFSAGVDTFTDSGTTSTGNNDGASDGTTSFDNCLRIAGDGASSTHYAIRATTLTVGNRYKAYVTAYMPTANSAVDGLEIGDSGPTYVNPPGQAKGKWITYEAEFTAAGTSLQIKMKSGTSDTFTAPTTDYIYISRILIKTL